MRQGGRFRAGFVVGLWLALSLGGCTSLAGSARVDGPQTGARPAFEGLISREPERPAVRYIFQTHGIASPGAEWTLALLDAIPDYGFVKDPAAGYPWRPARLARPMRVIGRDLVCDPPNAGCVFPSFGDYSKDVFVDKVTGETVVVFSYRWRDALWSITGHYVTPDIQENTLSGLSTRRSVINAKLKIAVMDEGLSDAAGYLSSLGTLEREGMETAICAMLADSIDLPDPPVGDGCLGRFDSSDLSRLRKTEFNFLSHSLGSRMLYDVLSGVVAPGGEAPSDRAMRTRGALRARTHELVMAANQMPLLAPTEFQVVAAPPAPAAGAQAALPPRQVRQGFVNLERPEDPATTPLAGPNLHLTVIAFQDPDDLLGFKASDAVIGSGDESVRFIDVLHRNTPQWAFLFAWPPGAHDRELSEKHSRRMILCGADADANGALKARDCASRRTTEGRGR